MSTFSLKTYVAYDVPVAWIELARRGQALLQQQHLGIEVDWSEWLEHLQCLYQSVVKQEWAVFYSNIADDLPLLNQEDYLEYQLKLHCALAAFADAKLKEHLLDLPKAFLTTALKLLGQSEPQIANTILTHTIGNSKDSEETYLAWEAHLKQQISALEQKINPSQHYCFFNAEGSNATSNVSYSM